MAVVSRGHPGRQFTRSSVLIKGIGDDVCCAGLEVVVGLSDWVLGVANS